MKGSITVYDRYRRVVGMNDEGIRTRGCKLCLDPKTEKLELAYFNKTMSVDDIVTELNSSNHSFYKHIRDHVRQDVSMTIKGAAPVLAEQIIDKQGEIFEILSALKQTSKRCLTILDGDLDLNMVKAFTMLISEQRKNIQLLAELQGQFNNEAKTVTNTFNIEYTQVVDKILQTACHNCRPKFEQELAPIINLKNIEKHSRSNL